MTNGLCECGCGGTTSIAVKTSNKEGIKKGEHRRFLLGHHNRRLRKNYTDEPKEKQFINKGYVYILCPDHPHPTQGRYVKRSRLVVEKRLGRYLTKEEQVHHINGDRTDDHPDNLEVLSLSEHNKLHRKINKMLEAKGYER